MRLHHQPDSAHRAIPALVLRAIGRDDRRRRTEQGEHGKDQDPERVITLEDGMIHLYKHAADGSEVVMGYIATEKEHGDYHLRLQYRWCTKKFQPRAALKRDAGLYYHIAGPDAVWPQALQFQIEQTDAGEQWVGAHEGDDKAAARWEKPS